LVTDTGSFRFNSVTPQTHIIASELINAGAENARIHESLFDNSSLNRLRFLGYVLLNKLEVIPEFRTALIVINQKELSDFHIQTGDTEGMVNYGLSIEGIELAALIVDRTKLVKMSFRSRGGFPANQLAREHFSGGGHYNAAGGQSAQTLDETVNRFKAVLAEYTHFLN
jgi:phosphoesterase RecJ-like protein